MRNLAMMLAGSTLALSPALAQTSTTTAPSAAATTTTTTAPADATAPAQSTTSTAPGASTTTTTGAGSTTTTTTAATAGSAEIAVGDVVNDPQGAKVGTVTATSGDLITVSTGTTKAQLPKKAFARADNGLVIGMTAAQLEAAVKAAGGGKGAAN